MVHDAIVIGGGIVGSAAAAHLADTGRATLLVERAGIGSGASGRNSGVVQHPFDPVLVELHRESLALYRALGDRQADGFGLTERPAGLLLASLEPDVAERLAAELAISVPDLAPAYLAPGAVTAVEPAIARTVSACRLDIGYPVGPLAATRAYAARAGEAGATIRLGADARPWVEDSRVRGVDLVDPTGVAVERLEAASVVVAAGPWSPGLIDPTGAWRPIEPRWGVVVDAVVPSPPAHVIEEAWIDIEPTVDSGAGTEAAPVDDGDGDHQFSLVTADGRSSVGSTFLAAEPDAAAWIPRIMERAALFVPALADVTPGPVRACARPQSRDGRPLIGAIGGVTGLWIAAGHGPWGISTGPAAGPLIVELLEGRRAAPPAALDPGRFGAVPLPTR
jgi:glycine/D-amino acid oxidase-like deaminating enzyme